MYKKLGVGKDIELPRLVIAGAQSCGKSSLLENLTGLPVPITTGIGTRFPIEITLIEDEKKFQIKPSIILDPKGSSLSALDMERMQRFNLGQVYNEPMTQIQFEEILREASDLFGVPAPLFARDQAANIRSVETPARQISSHVLQIEMRGPDFKSLSFVDTPGLYHSANSEQDATSVADIERLVVSLIEENRTVIVAVMEASQSTVGQKIFKFADDVDVNGSRTLGVMTKCDLTVTTETDAFEATLRRAKNLERNLNHGWYMVKNRSSTEAKAKVSLAAAREKEQKLFASPEWSPTVSGLDPKRLGIAALRTGLSNVFCAHIRAEFPAFNRQTQNVLSQKRDSLLQLGPDRSTVEKQREYLKSVVANYQEYKNACLRDSLKVSTDEPDGSQLLKNLNILKKSSLRDYLKLHGANWAFKTATMEYDFVSDSMAESTDYAQTKSIYSWINFHYQATKSSLIPGLVPAMLVERLFEEQTGQWRKITVRFLKLVKFAFFAAMEYSLDGACKNQLVVTALKDVMCKAVREKIVKFEIHCYDLVRNEQEGLQLVAGEEQFVREIREARTLRLISALTRLGNMSFLSSLPATGVKTRTSTATPARASPFTNLDAAPAPTSTPFSFGKAPSSGSETPAYIFGSADPSPAKANNSGNKTAESATKTEPEQSFQSLITFAQLNKDRLKDVLTDERQIVYEIHDILKAYYGTSLQHYTDAVCKNGLTPKFIREVMDVFSTEWVDSLSDEEVKKICAESVADRKTRRELGEDIERLERAIKESEMILNEPALV